MLGSLALLIVAGAAPAELKIDWRLTPRKIATSCKLQIDRARQRIRLARTATDTGLIKIETALADLNDARGRSVSSARFTSRTAAALARASSRPFAPR